MHLIIVGAGPIGDSLIPLATEAGRDVVVVESDSKRAEACADRHDVRVLQLNVADDDITEQADLAHAFALIATTEDDSINLMAMLLGREQGISVLTSVVNHDSHRRMFERLGVHVLADPEILVAQHLLDLTLLPHASDVLTLAAGEQVIKATITEQSELGGLTVAEIHQRGLESGGLVIVSVEHEDGEPFFPQGDTRLAAGDRIIIFARRRIRLDTLTAFCGDQAGQ